MHGWRLQASGGASRWFAFEAETDGVLDLNTDGSTFDTILAVYTGTNANFSQLTAVACDSDKPGTVAGDGSVTVKHAFGETKIPKAPSRVVSAGFTEQDVADGGSDALVDAIVAHGDAAVLDEHGNEVEYFTIERPHDGLCITATSRQTQ